MDAVFLLHHVGSDDEFADDAKLIGTYRSHEDAAAAVERLRSQSGFKDHPNGWHIQRWTVGEDHWEEGFSTLPEADLIFFRYEPEDETHGKLIAAGEAGDFTGTGEAWFPTEVLRNFIKACEEYPLSVDAPPSLKGGYWDEAGKVLQDTHLSIVLEPHEGTRAVRAVVQLATNADTTSERDVARSVTIRFLLAYADLQEFASRFQLLIFGTETGVSLRSSL